MIDRYGNNEMISLTNPDDPAAVAINATTMQGALDDASAEIDGYLQARYTLPLAVIPPVLVQICRQIARYMLYDQVAPEEIRNRYNDAVKWLNNLAKGIVNLGVESATGPNPTDGPTGIKSDTDRIFNAATLADY